MWLFFFFFVDPIFLPILNCVLTSWKTREEELRGKNEDHSKTCDPGVPQLIYSCVDRTLHLFIVFIYLLSSWISPATRLATVVDTLWFFIAIIWEGWNFTIGLSDYCAFYQIGCAQHLVLSVHSHCVSIVCFDSAKPVHSQSWKPTCSFFCPAIKSYTKPTASSAEKIYCWKRSSSFHSTSVHRVNPICRHLQHTPTHTDSSGYFMKAKPSWEAFLSALINRLNCT